MLQELNATILTLIPKIHSPQSMRDFRPIACCSTMYKCITKILANRMQLIMGLFVSNVQGAFVKGRDITDNIHIAQELARGYTRNGEWHDVLSTLICGRPMIRWIGNS